MGTAQNRPWRISFSPFVLDAANARLHRGPAIVQVRGKTLAVLEYLARRPGQLVTKNELLEALWPDTYVTETALAGCVRELRQALGDSRGQPRFIETVYGQGYRFIAATQPCGENVPPSAQAAEPGPPPGHEVAALSPIVGRDPELSQLSVALREAERGKRQVVFVAGDAGIGKSALVEAFVEGARRRDAGAALIARGQCIEQYGPGEPFLPVLEALTRLARQPADPAVAATVRQRVPRGLLSLPDETADVQPPGTTPERVVRVLVEAVEAVAVDHVLILWIEDLHWSDPSTLDVVSYLAQRSDPAHLLVIATYRPVDAIIRQHPLRIVEQELRTRQHSKQLALRLLSQSAVTDWLERLCPHAPPALAAWLYQRTDGNPLFLAAVMEDLQSAGLVQHAAEGWRVSPRFAEVGVPQSLRLMIDQQTDRLPAEDQRLLEGASAVGVRFSAAAAAAALGRDTVDIEDRCSALARRGQFVKAEGSADWPDGTVAGTYVFLHALYQNVLYDRLPPARRQQLHARIAQRLERGYGTHAEDCAVELAVHCELGRDFAGAIRYRERAAHRCNQRAAHREAAASLRRGLELVESLPDSRERSKQTLWLSLMLGAALIPTTGYADAALQATFQRCCDLAEQLGEPPQQFAALSGLATCQLARGELAAAAPITQRLLRLAEAMPVPVFRVLAHATAGWTRCCQGAFTDAVDHLMLATAAYAAEVPRETINIDPGTLACSALCTALVPLGRIDEARERMAEEVARCRRSQRATDRVTALTSASLFFAHIGEPESTEAHANEALGVAADNGLQEPVIAAVIHAWAVAMRDGSDGALAGLVERIAAYRAAGFGTYLSAILRLAAMAHSRAGKIETAAHLVAEGLDYVQSTGERWCEAELYRLRGELLAVPRRVGGTGKVAMKKKADCMREAERWIERALDVARGQGAKLWELRATTSLARLRHEQRRTAEARALLEPIATWFPQGQDSSDLRTANALLESLR